MELGLIPGWIESQQAYGQELSTAPGQNENEGEATPEFSNLLNQFNPSIKELMNPEDEYKGQKSSEVTTPVMDSNESDVVVVAPVLAVNSPLLNEIKNPVYSNISGSETNQKSKKVLDDLDRLRLKFFMQEEPIFRGATEQRIRNYAEWMNSVPIGLESSSLGDLKSTDLGSGDPGRVLAQPLKSEEFQVTAGFRIPQEMMGNPPESEGKTQVKVAPDLVASRNQVVTPYEVTAQNLLSDLDKRADASGIENPIQSYQWESELTEMEDPDLAEAENFKVPAENRGESIGYSKEARSDSFHQNEEDQKYKGDMKAENFPSKTEFQLGGASVFGNSLASSRTGELSSENFLKLNQERIDKVANLLIEKGGGSARIQLSPEGMGEIELRIRVQGDNVNVQFFAENAETKELFEKSMKGLKSQLEAHNLKLDSLNVQVAEVKTSNSADAGREQFQSNPNLGLLRDMMNQSRQESFARQSNLISEWDSIRSYGRGTKSPEPISSALEISHAKAKRYLGDGRGRRLSLVG